MAEQDIAKPCDIENRGSHGFKATRHHPSEASFSRASNEFAKGSFAARIQKLPPSHEFLNRLLPAGDSPNLEQPFYDAPRINM